MKNMYNFNMFGHCMSFKTKLLKHRNANNANRCADYLLQGYTDYPADNGLKNHPCYDVIQDVGRELLKPEGIYAKRELIGKHYQLVVILKDGSRLFSNYIYKDDPEELQKYNRLLKLGRKPLSIEEYNNIMNIKDELLVFFNNNNPLDFNNKCPYKALIMNNVNILNTYGWKVNFVRDENNNVQVKISGYHNYKKWVSTYDYNNKED